MRIARFVVCLVLSAAAAGASVAEEVCRGNNVTAAHVRDASKFALEEARKSGLTSDDPRYVAFVEQAFDVWMTKPDINLNPLLHRPVSGSVLAGNQKYAKALERLFVSFAEGDPNDSGRVIGGCPAEASNDVVAVMDKRNRRLSLCSGILISKDRVLTAAHCVCPILDGLDPDPRKRTIEVRTGQKVFHGGAYKSFSAVGADLFIGNDKCPKSLPPTFKERYENCAFCYPYKVQQVTRGKDFAVLQLNQEVPVSISVPRQILSAAEFLAESSAETALTSVVGYGFLKGDQGAGERRWGGIAIADWTCGEMERDTKCRRDREMVAARLGTSNTATCFHDSGGPLYVFPSSDPRRPKLAAITSRNVKMECGEGAIYGIVSTSEVLKWLERIGALP